jgi:hypothetical protein
MPPEERYAALVEALLGTAHVTLGAPGKRGFGSSALCLHGTIFALLSNGRLVVKLPRQRVEALIAAGDGEPYAPRRDGRVLKEWLAVAPTSDVEWLPLAREALAFVASLQ